MVIEVRCNSRKLETAKQSLSKVDNLFLPSSWIHIFSQYGHLECVRYKKVAANVSWRRGNDKEKEKNVMSVRTYQPAVSLYKVTRGS